MKKLFFISLTTGFTTAFIITLFITISEWIENPSGIFHNQEGTNWTFVYETAISWFVPTFIYVTVISGIVYFLFMAAKHILNNEK